jgi:hypothetical protein
MTKDQVYNYILVNTNQYFVGSENFEINDKVLDGLIWKAMHELRHMPPRMPLRRC